MIVKLRGEDIPDGGVAERAASGVRVDERLMDGPAYAAPPSAGGDAAIRFAFEQAAMRGWGLSAVYGGWEPGEVPLDAQEGERDTRGCGVRLGLLPWPMCHPQGARGRRWCSTRPAKPCSTWPSTRSHGGRLQGAQNRGPTAVCCGNRLARSPTSGPLTRTFARSERRWRN